MAVSTSCSPTQACLADQDPAQRDGGIEAIDPEFWDRVMRINLNGTLNTVQAAVPHMKRRRYGRIVVTASALGTRAHAQIGYPYVTAKAALLNLTRQLAVELAPFEIMVNALAPGVFRTAISGKAPPDPERMKQILAATFAGTICRASRDHGSCAAAGLSGRQLYDRLDRSHRRRGDCAMKLSMSLLPSPRTAAVLDGTIPIRGYEFDLHAADSVDSNSRRMLDGAFDVAEMSLATYVAAAGPYSEFIGIPVFPGRRFVHAGTLCRRADAMSSPLDLAGRRVAVPQYWLTSSIWHRGLLHYEYGIDPRAIDWVTVAPERGHASFPPGINVEYLKGASIARLLVEGEVDGALTPRPDHPDFIHPDIRCIFADLAAAEARSYARDAIFPIMHFLVARRDVLARCPGLAAALSQAFDEALPESDVARKWAHGIEPNRSALDAFLGYSVAQGLIAKAADDGEPVRPAVTVDRPQLRGKRNRACPGCSRWRVEVSCG